MRALKLTSRAGLAHNASMENAGTGLTGVSKLLVMVAGLFALSGCITVNAPEDKIVIELNINIQQEVLYRIADDVESTIQQNAEIF